MIEPSEPAIDPTPHKRATGWVLAAVLIFLVVRVYDVTIAARPASKSHAAGSASDMDTAEMADLVTTDMTAKTAFVYDLATGAVSRQYLVESVRSAELLDRDSGNSPSAARRLMILRSLVGAQPLARTKYGKFFPLNSFGADLPTGILPADRLSFAAEGRLWGALYGRASVSPGQALSIAQAIPRLSNIRWWALPALVTLYHRIGETTRADAYARDAGNRSIPSLAAIAALGLLRLGMLAAGVVIIIALLWIAWRKSEVRASSPAPGGMTYVPSGPGARGGFAPVQSPFPVAATPVPELWPSEPPVVAMRDRKLGAADLIAVFICYLLTRELLHVMLGGFSGFGKGHMMSFHGLMAPFMHRVNNLSPERRSTLEIVIESVFYVLSAVPPLALLGVLARVRRASLADEIGLNTRRLGVNSLYGIGGYCIATPILVGGVLITQHALRNFPAPSNPVIPQLILVNSTGAIVLLVALASIAAPIVEETLFRGVLYTALKIRTGVWPAIIMSGAIFGFLHPVGIAEMIPLALLGCVFAWMAETRQSLAPSMISHCINNLTSSLLLLSLMR